MVCMAQMHSDRKVWRLHSDGPVSANMHLLRSYVIAHKHQLYVKAHAVRSYVIAHVLRLGDMVHILRSYVIAHKHQLYVMAHAVRSYVITHVLWSEDYDAFYSDQMLWHIKDHQTAWAMHRIRLPPRDTLAPVPPKIIPHIFSASSMAAHHITRASGGFPRLRTHQAIVLMKEDQRTVQQQLGQRCHGCRRIRVYRSIGSIRVPCTIFITVGPFTTITLNWFLIN